MTDASTAVLVAAVLVAGAAGAMVVAGDDALSPGDPAVAVDDPATDVERTPDDPATDVERTPDDPATDVERTPDDDADPGTTGHTRVVTTNRSLVLDASADSLVRGETALPPGTELSVRLQSSGDSPFVKQAPATVATDGTFRTTFDLSDVDPGTTVTVSVVTDGETLASREATVVDGTATVTLDDASYEVAAGERLTVDGTADLPQGTTLAVRLHSAGESPFIVSREATVGPDGAFEASFETADLPPGARFQVSVVTENGTRVATAPGALTE